MNHLKRRSICKSCRACFIRDGETQIYCHGCLSDSLSTTISTQKRKKCLICAILFFPNNGRSTCGEECKKELNIRNLCSHKKENHQKLPEGPKAWDSWEREEAPPSNELGSPQQHRQVFVKNSIYPLYFKNKEGLKV